MISLPESGSKFCSAVLLLTWFDLVCQGAVNKLLQYPVPAVFDLVRSLQESSNPEIAAPMSTPASSHVTSLLAAWSAGDRAALDRLMPLVRQELHRLAERQLRTERPGHTLQATALVHEAYLRLVNQRPADWQSRAHFFAICAQLMRQILVDHARKYRAAKRGGGDRKIPLDEALVYAPERSAGLLALEEALTRLSQADERKGRVVELRFFGGLSHGEIAPPAVLGLSENTVIQDWAFARVWLQRALAAEQ
jgi:RNA polymerase sigma-70 factor, ECF subfamily